MFPLSQPIWPWDNSERSIHSFRKVISSCWCYVNCSSLADYAVSTSPAPTYATDNVTSVGPTQNDGPSFDNSFAAHHTPTAVLEHDPNSSRRKRRKTEDLTGSGPVQDFLGNGGPREVSEAFGQISNTAPHIPTAGTVNQAQDTRLVGSLSAADELSTSEPDADASATLERASKDSPKRKTLKLNANGKLLSSPTSTGVEDKSRPKTNCRSKRGNRKIKEDRKALVVIKYANEDDHRERIGKLIDDIFSGRSRQGVPERPAFPTSTENPPPKPTHPFFLKKPTHNTDTSSQSVRVTKDSAVTGSPEGDARKDVSPLTSSGGREKYFASFRRRPKFPEPIDSLWPPRDFVHVRGFDTVKDHRSAALYSRRMDQKKAKMASIRIDDQENVLLSTSTEAQRSGCYQVGKSLRLPGRQVASGRVLQKAVSKQLSSCDIGGSTDGKGSFKHCHPAIKRLSSSLSSSTAAFDRGELESLLWATKYIPNSAEEVLQTGREPLMLRDWLKYLMVSAVDTGKLPKDQANTKEKEGSRKRSKKRKRTEELEGFIVSSGSEQSEMEELSDPDEDELAGAVTVPNKRTVIRSGDLGISSKPEGERGRISNAILLSGPSGCGKTASVYAVANELDFEVFEINPGSRRSSRDVLEQVGDMTRNHLVNNLNTRDDQPSSPSSQTDNTDEGKQNKMRDFLKAVSAKQPKPKEVNQEGDRKSAPSQRQSLILLEEADILFEEDKQFWSGVITLMNQSKRPIVITCNDESLIPLEDISLHAILRYRAPPQDLAADYLLLVAANEGHMLIREAVEDLYTVYKKDLRKAITDLNFWCQMGIGSEKSGLDWIVDRWPPGSDLDQHGDPLRVISLNAYQRFMGWFSRDVMLNNTLDSEIESCQESLHWWHLGIQDSESMSSSTRLQISASEPESSVPRSNTERLRGLREASEYADMRSDLDMLSSTCTMDLKKVGAPFVCMSG